MSKTKADVICGKNGFLVTEYLAGDPRSLSVREICQLRELWATGFEKKKREKKGNYPYLRVSADQRSGFSSAGGDDDVDGLSWKKKWYSNFFFCCSRGSFSLTGIKRLSHTFIKASCWKDVRRDWMDPVLSFKDVSWESWGSYAGWWIAEFMLKSIVIGTKKKRKGRIPSQILKIHLPGVPWHKHTGCFRELLLHVEFLSCIVSWFVLDRSLGEHTVLACSSCLY